MPVSRRTRGFDVRGDLLRSLRQTRGWTQEEAAHRAGVSDKLIRKAEGGGRIDGRSLAALASLYAVDDALPDSRSLLVGAGPAAVATEAQTRPAAVRLLKEWLQGIWSDPSLAVVERLASPTLQFHFEDGTLVSLAALRSRYEAFRASFSDMELTIDAIMGDDRAAASRWSLMVTPNGRGRATPAGERIVYQGTTEIKQEQGSICFCAEFWDARTRFEHLAR